MVLLCAVLALTTTTQTGDIEVPFHRLDDAFIVDVTVNNRPLALMLDTGFGGTVVVDQSMDVGKSTGKIGLTDFVGQHEAETVDVKSMKIGAQSIEPAGKKIVKTSANAFTLTYGVHCDGIMGLEAIKDHVVEFNFEHNKLIFHPKSMDISTRQPDNKRTFLCKMLPTGASAIVLPVVASTGKKMTLSLDTGNAFYATTHKETLNRVGLWDQDRDAKFQMLSEVASGPVASWYYRMKDATIFGVPVKESYWDVIDVPSSTAESDGTIGFGFLSNFNIVIDYERRRVWFDNYAGKVSNDSPGDTGISAAYDPQAKRVRVFLVAPDSPAEKAGIKANDYLLSVNGVDTAEIGFRSLKKLLEGPVDSKVQVATSRGGVLNRQELVRKQLVND